MTTDDEQVVILQSEVRMSLDFWLILVRGMQDLEYVIQGMLAISNAVCLVLIAVFLGYGLAEAPKGMFQVSHSKFLMPSAWC